MGKPEDPVPPDRDEKLGKFSEPDRNFDLEERTARFGERIIAFAKSLPITPVTTPIITQMVKAGTSVGANYNEADDACSRKDFRHKMTICRKESRESKYWLRMSAAAVPELAEAARQLWQEAKQLHLIFAASVRTCDANSAKEQRRKRSEE